MEDTMSRAEENLNDWLRDAHAMEQQAEKMLQATVSRVENYPDLRDRLQQHLEETREQARLLKSCIDRCGAGTSTMKDMAAKMTGMGQGLSGLFVSDEVVKATLASYTFEHMEIASYRSLIAAAEAAGDAETATVCRNILPQEEAMAEWLGKRIGEVTQRFLQLAETPGATAKR
jgi:ferritin-like metal-binding protein YciE